MRVLLLVTVLALCPFLVTPTQCESNGCSVKNNVVQRNCESGLFEDVRNTKSGWINNKKCCCPFDVRQDITVKPLVKYPGYTGTDVTGSVQLTFIGYSVTMDYDLTGVEEICASPDANSPNSCGLHIHKGTTCATREDVGGHYYDQVKIPEDPWGEIVFKSSGTTAKGTAYIPSFGHEVEATMGHAIVVHNRAGERVACAVIPTPKSVKIPASSLVKYPDYVGTGMPVAGSVQLNFVGDTVSMIYDLSGVEEDCTAPDQSALNSCGIHIHGGASCAAASEVGGHYYDSSKFTTDPWVPVVYVAAGNYAKGTTIATFGYDFEASLGRTIVVHDHAGRRVSCAVIPGARIPDPNNPNSPINNNPNNPGDEEPASAAYRLSGPSAHSFCLVMIFFFFKIW